MSADGILAEFDNSVTQGSRVQFAIDWLGTYHGADRCKLVIIGRVVRCDGRFAAVTVLHSEFRTVGRLHSAASPHRAVA
jgi:hypothetical protein